MYQQVCDRVNSSVPLDRQVELRVGGLDRWGVYLKSLAAVDRHGNATVHDSGCGPRNGKLPGGSAPSRGSDCRSPHWPSKGGPNPAVAARTRIKLAADALGSDERVVSGLFFLDRSKLVTWPTTDSCPYASWTSSVLEVGYCDTTKPCFLSRQYRGSCSDEPALTSGGRHRKRRRQKPNRVTVSSTDIRCLTRAKDPNPARDTR